MNTAVTLIVTAIAFLSLLSLIVLLAGVACLMRDSAGFEKLLGEAKDID